MTGMMFELTLFHGMLEHYMTTWLRPLPLVSDACQNVGRRAVLSGDYRVTRTIHKNCLKKKAAALLGLVDKQTREGVRELVSSAYNT